MSITSIPIDGGGNRLQIKINNYPDVCPWCEKGIQPKTVVGHSLGNLWDYDEIVEYIFKCPNNDCGRYFIAYYKKVDRTSDYFVLNCCRIPCFLEPFSPSEEINNVSPSFSEIFNQSKIAEDMGLKQICGGGYRKSLEFLLKEYLIKENPERKEYIKSAQLGDLIDKMTEGKIQTCAKRAAWLGNDEIHFLRKWEDKDISNLKDLIKLTQNWIESEIMTKKYSEDMK